MHISYRVNNLIIKAMKCLTVILLVGLSTSLFSQTLSPTLTSSMGADYSSGNANLSVSIGEPVTATYPTAGTILTCGFQQGENATHRINMTLYLEGLFNGVGQNKAMDENGTHWPGNIADKLQVSLARNVFPYDILFTNDTVDLMTDGTAAFLFPVKYSGLNYVVIKHRNSLETWTAVPLSLASNVSTYNFTVSASRAYGNNLVEYNGKYVIYSGDANLDGIIDGGDMSAVDNLSAAFSSGYLQEDINGDGLVDGTDMSIVDNNSSFFVGVLSP